MAGPRPVLAVRPSRRARAPSRRASIQPAQDGSSTDAPNTGGSSAPAARAFVRRIDPIRARSAAIRAGASPAAPRQRSAAPSGRALEAELAERLDTVLGIAGRLAASHDRADLFRMIVDETKRALRADATTIRVLRDDRLEVAAWAGLPDDAGQAPAGLPPRRGLGRRGPAHRPRPRLPRRSRRSTSRQGAVRRRVRGRRPPDRAAHPPRPGDRRAVGGHPRAAGLDERRRRVHHDPGHARRDRPRQRRAVRADRGAGRPARGPPGRLRPDEPERRRRKRSAGRSSRRRAGSSTTTTPGSTSIEPPDKVVPIAFEGRVGAYEHVDMELLTCTLGEGFTGWVALARRADPRQRRQPRPARRDDRRDRRHRRVDAGRADAPRRRDDRRHHAVQARARRVRTRRPAAADDPRRPGGHRRSGRPAC